MDNILIDLIARWGTAGLFVIAGGYIIWDSWKKSKKIEEWFRDKVTAQESRSEVNNSLTKISDKLDGLKNEHDTFCDEIRGRVATIEASISKHHPDHHHVELQRMTAVTHIAPSIHSLIAEGLKNCECDHIAVALLHNGNVSLSGIPYVKFGVIAEKYKPIHNPQDIDLTMRYKDEDITSHNRLPSCIVQNPQVEFEITPDSPLIDIDPIIYNRCAAIGIKRIGFEAIRDIQGLTTGFTIIYKFDDSPLDMVSLHNTTSAIEDLYRNMLASFD